MRSLFLKVFLWFWLAMALVIVALLLTVELTRSRQPFPLYTGMDRIMDVYSQTAVATYEREGRAGLINFFGEPQTSAGTTFYLFDEQGAEVTGRSAPADVLEAARRAAATGKIIRGTPGERMFGAHPVVTAGGHRYVVVDVSNRARGGPFSDHPMAQALRVLAVLLTAGVLCYLLARYIVAPVVKLRAVTRQVSSGDLSAASARSWVAAATSWAQWVVTSTRWRRASRRWLTRSSGSSATSRTSCARRSRALTSP